MKLIRLSIVCLLIFSSTGNAKEVMDVNNLLKVGWVKQAKISPDGKSVVYAVQRKSLETNKSSYDLYLADVESGNNIQLTTHQSNDYHPTWSPDSQQIIFVAQRGDQEMPQLWTIARNGGEAQPLTDICTGAANPMVSPNGAYIAFFSDVYPQCKDISCNCKMLEEKKKIKATGKVYDQLLYRHWNHWRDERRSHLMLYDIEHKKVIDLTPGVHDVPPISLGGIHDISFSPDSMRIAYASNTDSVVATSTNNDIFIIPVKGGTVRRMTKGHGNDHSPRFSPDGRWLAYLSMKRAGFESDLSRLMIMDLTTRKSKQLAINLDRPVSELVWNHNATGIYFLAHNAGNKPLYFIDLQSPDPKVMLTDAYLGDLTISNNDHISFISQTIDQPGEVFYLTSDNKPKQLSAINTALMKNIITKPYQEFYFTGGNGDKVQGFILQPPYFKKSKKYPLILLIHGGPQGVFGNSFHPRWNAQAFASQGNLVATINFHGSIGFGQKFTDEISKDWGGAAYQDILKGVDFITHKYRYVNKRKICAAGASYGGFMINWIAGHTDQFQCLISHAGVFNIAAKYGSTEELWFPEWEFGGIPWKNPELYEKWSPHKFAGNFKTPTLVIHGANDYRVPLEQGLGMFTALQRNGVPSKLLFFPDEDHFVTQPANIKLWWDTMHAWFGTYLK